MKPDKINWKLKAFDELTISELYEMLRLRAGVFVVEQDCAYQDLDGLDDRCFHLLGRTEGGILAAYARILPEGVDAYGLNGTFTGPHGGLGRLVVAPACRGIGHLVIDKALEAYDKVVGKDIPCVIHAQAHLQRLYEAHGFVRTGEICILDQREHVEMTRPCHAMPMTSPLPLNRTADTDRHPDAARMTLPQPLIRTADTDRHPDAARMTSPLPLNRTADTDRHPDAARMTSPLPLNRALLNDKAQAVGYWPSAIHARRTLHPAALTSPR